MTHRYRKKPVEVEAAHFKNQDKAEVIAEWCGGRVETRQNFEHPDRVDDNVKVIMVDTLEGVMRADPDDYIICGVKGEFYPCKPDVFEQSYDLVE